MFILRTYVMIQHILIPDDNIGITTTENQEQTTIIPTTLATIGKYTSQ